MHSWWPWVVIALAACGESASDAVADAEDVAVEIDTAEPEDVPVEIDIPVEIDSAEPEDVPVEIDTEVDTFEPPPTTEVETGAATALGLDALSVNGRVHAHGRPASYYFELGETPEYGLVSAETALPARLGAHYRETWDQGFGGWAGGMSGLDLIHEAEGGIGGSGFVRYPFPGGLDANHADGIGANELIQYMYPGAWEAAPPYAAFAGGDPDMRGARFSVSVRGNDFVQHGSELVFWMQSTPNLAEAIDPVLGRWSNWAYSAANLTEQLLSGEWEEGHYQLLADTNLWTYAGHYVVQDRPTYIYRPLDEVLSHLNGDFFHMQVFFEYHLPAEGSIDFDDLAIEYPQRSLLAPVNGGKLVSAPGGPTERLTDGWRHGADRTWQAEASAGPLEIVWELGAAVTLDAIQVHQDPEHPAKEIEVLASEDGTAWEPLARGTLPESSADGPNFAFYLYDQVRADRDLALGLEALPWRGAPTRYIKVRVLSGYGEVWGLGEVEAYGRGVPLPTEDDWNAVTADFTGLVAGTTYHFRVVAIDPDGTVTQGPDRTFAVPATRAPLVTTQPATRIRGGTAKVEGRVSPLGESTNYWFDYGPADAETYAQRTFPRYAGLELTPRTVTDILPDLVPGTLYRFRLVAENTSGTRYGDALLVMAE